MKATELRLGNLVCLISDVGDAPEYIETTVGVMDIEQAIKQEDFFQGIPITEEWLKRFGFDYDKNTSLYSKNGYDVDFVQFGYIEFYLSGYGSRFKILEHIHQLENIYFAITGEELEYV